MPLAFTLDGPVARITLNRPDRLNALNEDVRRAFAAALDELEDRPDVRVLVLAGAGRSFCAGADVRTTSYPPVEGDWATRRHRTGTWQRVMAQLDRVPQATVARLHGHVIGGGALLAAACDIRVAADDTVLRIAELALGVPNVWGGNPVLVREVGLPRARDWVMTARQVHADELALSGFAQRLVPRDDLDAAVEECVAQLLATPAGPAAMTRAMFAAIGRSQPAIAAGWADADLQQWAFTEDEYRAHVSRYVRGVGRRPAPGPAPS